MKKIHVPQYLGFSVGASSKEPACQCRRIKDAGSIPVSGRSSQGGHGNPFQYYCLENPMDRGAWQAVIHRVVKHQTQLKWLGTHIPQYWLYHYLKWPEHGSNISNFWILPFLAERNKRWNNILLSFLYSWALFPPILSWKLSLLFTHSLMAKYLQPHGLQLTKSSLSFTISWSLLKLISIESMMPSNHLILCHFVLFLPPIFSSFRVFPMSWHFASCSQIIGASASAWVPPMNTQD